LLGIEVSRFLGCTIPDSIKVGFSVVNPLDFLLENSPFLLQFPDLSVRIDVSDLHQLLVSLGRKSTSQYE
jgi:hypothetical protein